MIKQKIILINILIKKTINTFLTPRYNLFYFNVDKKYLKKKKPNKNFFYFFSKLWFIPSIENSRYWMNVKLDDKIHGAQHYLKFTKNSKDLINAFRIILFRNCLSDSKLIIAFVKLLVSFTLTNRPLERFLIISLGP